MGEIRLGICYGYSSVLFEHSVIRNTPAVGFLSASVGAVNTVRSFGRKYLAAHFAYTVLASFKAFLRQFLLISAITAQTIKAILLGFDVRIKLSATALADDLSDRVVWAFAGHLFLIAFFQIRLISVFPFAVPHQISSFHDKIFNKTLKLWGQYSYLVY